MMTTKQKERIQAKIAGIKQTLATERRKFSGYDDSRGLRYLPTRYYLQLEDYAGGLAYTRWFAKNFPDDSGFPDFLFEWTLILYKNAKSQEASKKAFATFCSDTDVFGYFLNKTAENQDIREETGRQSVIITERFPYSCTQKELADFAIWLDALIATEWFSSLSHRFTELNRMLDAETDIGRRHELVMELSRLQKAV
ncbi:hypothetical protein [Dyadobacter sp. NIV53]|uniref:hypothetical protein n=1 Tax=Dyadobacter sp. NIV53 TaxID=2861765 RepID=UPI001C87BD58|nr:hypothetical protein [Dyadobacter sp. NIV53]